VKSTPNTGSQIPNPSWHTHIIEIHSPFKFPILCGAQRGDQGTHGRIGEIINSVVPSISPATGRDPRGIGAVPQVAPYSLNPGRHPCHECTHSSTFPYHSLTSGQSRELVVTEWSGKLKSGQKYSFHDLALFSGMVTDRTIWASYPFHEFTHSSTFPPAQTGAGQGTITGGWNKGRGQ